MGNKNLAKDNQLIHSAITSVVKIINNKII